MSSSIVPLHGEPHGNNPPKLIGYYDRRTHLVLTPKFSPSKEEINGKPSKIHLERLKAVRKRGSRAEKYEARPSRKERRAWVRNLLHSIKIGRQPPDGLDSQD